MNADVQLEHGHLRVANRLIEAILRQTEFTGTQVRILLALIRLTYGWRKKTVRCGMSKLAYLSGSASVNGSFRTALNLLVRNRVVIQVVEGKGADSSVWTIQKDFTKWKNYQLGPDYLSGIFDERPESNDEILMQGDFLEDHDPIRSDSVPLEGQTVRPLEDTGTPPNSLIGETLQRRNTGKTGKTESSSSAGGPENQPEMRARPTPPGAMNPESARLMVVAQMHDHMPAVDRLLELKPRDVWPDICRMILQLLGPMTGLLPEDVAGGIEDALIEKALTPVAIRAFAQAKMRERLREELRASATAAASNGSLSMHAPGSLGPTDDALWQQALSVCSQLHRRQLSAQQYRDHVPWRIRYGISVAGGWRALHDCPPGQLSFLKRDFLKSIKQVPPEPEPVEAL